jgi:predicted ATPase/class 3 adenylate cyclase
MVEPLPTGTVTFLFTDLEGSTRLWQEHPEAMKDALARHDEILRDAIAAHEGHVVKTTGDGVHAAFASAADAVGAARDAQLALARPSWDSTGPLRVRIGLHTGQAEVRDGDYYGTSVNKAARLMSAAHGGQIVVSLATEELLRDDGAGDCTLLDLGEHRLRDLAQGERVFQVCAPGLRGEFPPLRSLETYPTNLSTQLSSFVGREAELADIVDSLSRTRLVTVTGMGGVGKTRLATQVAANLLPEFADGAWLCELAAASNPETMVQAVASTLGTAQRAGMSLEESVVEFLRGREALLVLDNCEHLLDAAARLATAVLAACPRVRIVATSREGLAVDGEQVYPLRSLGLPVTADLDGLVSSDAARLFAERASGVRPAFAIDADNAAAVAEICRRLDGIPLAIELAAARLASMSAGDVARHLDERFRLLTGGRRTAVERHHTLRATVDWSYSLLDATDQAVFDRLGVFAGGFDQVAAQAVCAGEGVDPWDVVDALASLVAKSMVVPEETGAGTTRYQLLETMRQYSLERLAERGEADEYRRCHAEHFVTFAEAAGEGLLGTDELQWRARLRDELANLRSAVTWALDAADETGDDGLGELAVRIIAPLTLQATLDRSSGVAAWARDALERAERSSPERRAAIRAAASWDAFSAGDYERARNLCQPFGGDGNRALELSPLTVNVGVLCVIEMYTGRFDRAREVLEQYGQQIEGAENVPPFARVVVDSTWAMIDILEGHLEPARERSERAVDVAREQRNPSALALALYTLGWACMDVDADDALTLFDEAVDLVRLGATDMVLAHSLARAAALRADRGDPAAITQVYEALTFAREIGSRPTLMTVLDYAVDVLAALGRTEGAAVVAGYLADSDQSLLYRVEGTEDERRQRSRERARSALGDERYELAAKRGAKLREEELVRFLADVLETLRAEEPL